jgi:hypothetical protein
MTAPRFPVAARRARLVRRHRLSADCRGESVEQVVADLVALHGTDPATVYLSAAARLRDPDLAAIERALYEERTLLRMLGMRRTMFVVPDAFAPVVHAACTQAIAARERRRNVQFLAAVGIAEPAAWLVETERRTMRALAELGEATGAELAAAEPRLREQIVVAPGKSYGGAANVTSRVLFVLAAQGRIVRGRPRGSWTSAQFRWSLVERWLPGGMPELDPVQARAELVRAWLARFGPGTLTDLQWWTGLPAREVRQALTLIGPDEVDLDGAAGLVLPGDGAPRDGDPGDGADAEAGGAPEAVLLPALDPTVMGWQQRDWFLGEHGPALFDRTGNAGPTVWWGGRVVGGWGQRADGEIAVRLLADVGGEGAQAVRAEADRLAARLGPARIGPRARVRSLVEAELVG